MGRTFAAAVGAFVGALLGLHFQSGVFATILSLAAGGMAAWVGYDIRGFIAGVRRAFKESRTEFSEIDWKHFGWSSLYALSVSARSYMIFGLILFFVGLVKNGVSVTFDRVFTWSDMPDIFLIHWMLALLPGVVIGFVAYSDGESFLNDHNIPRAAVNGWVAFLKYCNPIVWTFWIVVGVLVGLWQIITHIPEIFREGWRFLQLAFAYTHTEDRMLCFLDAMFGAAVGIYYGSPLIGAGIGALVGKLYSPLTRGPALRLRQRFETEMAQATGAKTA